MSVPASGQFRGLAGLEYAVAAYAAVNSAPYVTGTASSFSGTFTVSAGNLVSYSVRGDFAVQHCDCLRLHAASLRDGPCFLEPDFRSRTLRHRAALQLPSRYFNFFGVRSFERELRQRDGGRDRIKSQYATTHAGGATTFSSVTGLSGDLSIFSNGCTGSQTSCTTVIHYTPSATGTVSQTVTYTDSATGSPQTVAITGTGIPAAPSATPSPTSVNFGNVQLGHSSTSGPVTVAF